MADQNSGKHARPDIDSLDAKIVQLAEDFVAGEFAAERSATALDGFIAGFKAAERHFDGRSQ